MTTKSEIESLLLLLEDPDPFIQESVQNRFNELGENAIPLLDEYRAETKNPEEKTKLGSIIHQLTFPTLRADFHEVLEKGVKNREGLEVAAFTLARFGNPTLRIKEYQKKLDHLLCRHIYL